MSNMVKMSVAPSSAQLADQNGVLVHLLHILVSMYAYSEVVLHQYFESDKKVYFFAHPWFWLGILVDAIGIIRYCKLSNQQLRMVRAGI